MQKTRSCFIGYLTRLRTNRKFETIFCILDELVILILTIRKICRDSIVYKDNAVSTRNESFLFLGPYKKVNNAVLIAWSSHLNNMEKLKAAETVSRLFFSTQTSVSQKIIF